MKKVFCYLIIVLSLACVTSFSLGSNNADTPTKPKYANQDYDETQRHIYNLEKDIEIIRRDQVNYRTEKDLLKDAYNSNIQVVNIIIAIVLALFTIFGYFGLRDIGKLKTDYTEELRQLRTIREEFTAKSESIKSEQQKTINNLENIVKTYEEQNRRIKILELLEKVDTYVKNQNYIPAFEFISAAIGLDPDDTQLLKRKGYLLTKLIKYIDAIETYETILSKEKDDITSITNLIELYLLTGQVEKYRKAVEEHQEIIHARQYGMVAKCLDIFSKYIGGNIQELKDSIRTLIDNEDKIKELKAVRWDFGDIKNYLKRNRESKEKDIFENFIDFVIGELDLGGLETCLESV